MEGRINSWKNRYLSQGGKETLIKAVALALPTYSMSCFRLPRGLVKRLTRLLASFWWKNHETARGIHWASWQRISKHKNEGGLGFRDIEGFNQALLGKQIWRLANNPDSLLAKVLKSRYFPRSSVLDARIGSRPSFAWRSIHSSQPLMRQGMQRVFGGGVSVDILSDPWIGAPMPRAPQLKGGIDTTLISLDSLKIQASDEWNLSNLHYFFEESEVKAICKVFTSPSQAVNKSYRWIHNASRHYSVKSGYWTMPEHAKVMSAPNFSGLYEAIWKLRCPPKIHHFLWRCLSGSLPVGEKLAAKKLTKDPICLRCGEFPESIDHTLFQCAFARLIWALSPIGGLFYPSPASSLYVNFASCLFSPEEASSQFIAHLKSWPWIVWRLWKSRNELCFKNIQDDAQKLIQLALEEATGWDIANTTSTTTLTPPLYPLLRYHLPLIGNFRLFGQSHVLVS